MKYVAKKAEERFGGQFGQYQRPKQEQQKRRPATNRRVRISRGQLQVGRGVVDGPQVYPRWTIWLPQKSPRLQKEPGAGYSAGNTD